jgi:predicted RNA binding protein YcfA (HicA-like mRNA interferase family)
MADEKRVRDLYEKALRKPASLKFRELCTLTEGVGFRLDRIRGSHHAFVHDSSKETLILQPKKGHQAKPYQVRQLLALVKQHNLLP